MDKKVLVLPALIAVIAVGAYIASITELPPCESEKVYFPQAFVDQWNQYYDQNDSMDSCYCGNDTIWTTEMVGYICVPNNQALPICDHPYPRLSPNECLCLPPDIWYENEGTPRTWSCH